MPTSDHEFTIGLTLVCFCSGLPVLGTDDGQTHLTLLVNVGVVNFSLECDLGRLEWVFRGEFDLDFKGSFVVWYISLWNEKTHAFSNTPTRNKDKI